MFLETKREGEAPVKTGPFNLATLTAWLEQQPQDKTYCYMDTGHCLLAQYFTAQGFKEINLGATLFYHRTINGKVLEKVPPQFNRIAADGDKTFGAALSRSRFWVREI